MACAWIHDDEEAGEERVYGLPSIKIDSIDVEQDLMMYEPFGVWTRRYRQGSQVLDLPAAAAIREALVSALAARRRTR